MSLIVLCPTCHGKGKIRERFIVSFERKCPECRGEKTVGTERLNISS